jgi:hypothetical protein
MISTKARHEQLRNKSVVSDIMGRRTAARVVPTAEPTASTCSSKSALVFTPLVPVEHVADDRESGAASNSRYREDGQEYVSHPRAPAFQSVKWDARSVPVGNVGRCFWMRSTVETTSSQPNEPILASPERATSADPTGASSSLKPAPLLHRLRAISPNYSQIPSSALEWQTF